jgi:hypothetical protein
MDQLDAGLRTDMQSIVNRRTQPFDTEQAILEEIRAGLDLGTATAPAVNAEFKLLYREVIGLAADPNSGADPKVVEAQDAAQAAVIYAFLPTLKRSILRLTQNMSVYGTLGTSSLVEKWSGIVNDGLAVLDKIGRTNVVSPDQDDQSAWAVLAAVTGTPRSTVKAYVVNGHNGGQLLKLVIGAYKALQDAKQLDDEDGRSLYDIFFTRRDLVSGQANSLSLELKRHAGVLQSNLTQLWP